MTLMSGLRCHSLYTAGYSPEPANPLYHGRANWRVGWSGLQSGLVFGLVEADFGAAGEAKFSDGSPAGFFDGGEDDSLFGKGGNFGFQVVAHQVELVLWSVGGVDGGLGGRE